MIKKINISIKNKKLFFILLSIIIITVILLVMIFSKNGLFNRSNNLDGEKFKDEYEELNGQENEEGRIYPKVELPKNNIIKYSNVSEILSIFENKGDGVIYFGDPKCLYCRNAIEVLCNVAADTELDVIYYLEIENEEDNYNKLLEVLGDEFIINKDGNKELYIPLVIFVTYGEIASYNKGTLFSQEDPYVELDKYQVEGLSEIYRYGIRDVLNSSKNK